LLAAVALHPAVIAATVSAPMADVNEALRHPTGRRYRVFSLDAGLQLNRTSGAARSGGRLLAARLCGTAQE
jgi:hypothetical protein